MLWQPTYTSYFLAWGAGCGRSLDSTLGEGRRKDMTDLVVNILRCWLPLEVKGFLSNLGFEPPVLHRKTTLSGHLLKDNPTRSLHASYPEIGTSFRGPPSRGFLLLLLILFLASPQAMLAAQLFERL